MDPSPTTSSAFLRPDVPDHELIRVIGEGSYGEVWLARNLFSQYRAIKVVRRSAFADVRPFERELNGVRQFEPVSRSHEALVDILHVGESDDGSYFYCIMELADDENSGQQFLEPLYRPKTLAREIANRSSLPIQECVRFGLALTDGLRVLHTAGLVHRDIKPSNIVFVNGVAKLADIGLVHSIAGATTFVGTQGYIPPEGPGTVQADIYSLGKVLYEAATGNDRQQFPELPDPILKSPESKQLTEFNEVIVRACDGQATRRYRTAEELYADLEVLQSGQSLRRLRTLERRWQVLTKFSVVAALVIVGGGAIGFSLFWQHQKAGEARAAQVLAALNYGSKLLDEKDEFSALPWFVDALRGESHNKDRAAAGRTRIASIFRNAPLLVHCLWQTSGVHCAQFVPGDKAIAFGDDAGVIRTVDLSSKQVMRKLVHNTNIVARTLRFSGNGLKALTTDNDSCVRVWRFDTGDRLAVLPHRHYLHSAAFSPDGEQILTASGNGTLLLWDISSQSVVQEFKSHHAEIWNASFSADGRNVVSSGQDGLVIVWDAATAEIKLKLKHPSWVYDAVFSPDDKSIATVCFDRSSLRVWDVEHGQLTLPPLLHAAKLNNVRFSPDTRFIVTTSVDGSVRLWNRASGELATSTLHHGGNVTDATFSADGRYLLTASWDKTVRIWDLQPWISSPVRETYSSDGKTRFQIEGQEVTAFPTASSEPIGRCSLPYAIDKLVINDCGSRFLALPKDASRSEVHGYDLDQHVGLRSTPSIDRSPARWTVAEQSAVAVICSGNVFESWNLRQGVLLARWRIAGNPAAIVIAPSGKTVAVAISTNVYLFDAKNGRELTPPLAHALPVSCAAFNADGSRLLTGCADTQLSEGYACVWNAVTGNPVSTRLAHHDGIVSVAFSPDERLVATGGEDYIARVWQVSDGRALALFHHKKIVSTVRFSPNGQWLITGSLDKTARVWDVQTSSPITPPIRHPTAVSAAAFDDVSGKLVSVVAGGSTRLWDLRPDTNTVETLSLAARFFEGNRIESGQDQTAILNLVESYARDERVGAVEWHQTQAGYSELAGEFFAARFHLNKLLKRGPSDDLYVRLSRANAELQQWKEALAMFSRVSDRIRNDDEILVKIGLLQLAVQPEECHKTLRRLSTMPEPSTSVSCGWLLILAGKAFEAPEVASQLLTNLARCPQTYVTSILLAGIHDLRGEKNISRRFLEATIPPANTPADLRALATLLRANSGDAAVWKRAKAETLGAVDMTSLPWEQRLRVQLLFEQFGITTNTFGKRADAAGKLD